VLVVEAKEWRGSGWYLLQTPGTLYEYYILVLR